MAHNPITLKIKNEYGTVEFFCKKNNINPNTLRQVIYGLNKSARIINILKKHNYIKDCQVQTKNAPKCSAKVHHLVTPIC